MRAGRLRHRLTIQVKNLTRDSAGQQTHSWTDFKTVWGSVEPLSGREFEAQDQGKAETKTRIIVRYVEGITTEMRVLFGQLTYNIQTVIHHDHRQRQISLLCSEGLSDGA